MRNPSEKLLFVENLRIFLIILVILLHISIIYGGVGNYPIREKPTEDISPIILTFFNAICQSFFMSLFFLISGYFVPASFDKKGPKLFLRDRFIRLGIPLLVYTTFFRYVLDYLFSTFRGEAVTFRDVLLNDLIHPAWVIGPLWFVEALLIFCIVYTVYRTILKRFPFIIRDAFPANKSITLTIIILALLTFIVRIFFPVGREVHVFQLGHFVHYIFCFFLGIISYRKGWIDDISSRLGLWKKVSIGVIIALPFLLFLGKEPELFIGGFTLQSFIFSLWESIACYSIIIALVSLFKERFASQSSLTKWMAPNVYTVYIIHQLIVTPLSIIFLYTVIPSYVKFIIVSILAVPLCFLFSGIIRKISITRKVLG